MSLPVVLAIPNYNMGESLRELLPTVIDRGYKEIFVLDDYSTDDSQTIVASLNLPVHFVSGKKNIGAGGNRNRILEVLTYDAIIHFLDADMILDTTHSAEVISHIVPDSPFSFIGGLCKTITGKQSIWNYGPLTTFDDRGVPDIVGSPIQSMMANTQFTQHLFARFIHNRPNPSQIPVRKEVGWVIEQNMVVDSRIFSNLGGFDPSLREHEILDYALRARKMGLRGYFDPSLVATHKEIAVREYNRQLMMLRTKRTIMKKHHLPTLW